MRILVAEDERDLNRLICRTLERAGYSVDACFDGEAALDCLARRIEADNGQFPHEIGLFLGYPVEDVHGFIVNGGKNFCCSGCWKVYCNQCEKEKLFRRYKKCGAVYLRLFQNGRSVWQLTVAA